MSQDVRPFVFSDYETVSRWWQAHNWDSVPIEYLPATGFIVDGLCAGFLYRTDSAFCWLEFVVGNPQSDKLERDRALNSLIDALILKAKTLGFRAVHTSVKHPSLLKRYAAAGFTATDSAMTNMVRVLGS